MTAVEVLAEPDWLAREAAHAERMRRWTVPHQERRARGEKHPVLDFLFTYYSYRPSHLQRWQPGPGVALVGPAARRFLDRKGYVETSDGVVLDPEGFTEGKAKTAEFVLGLLTATASRAPRLGCFGLHEWAMVYREPPDSVRHAQVPLRLGAAGTDAVVESLEIRCGHFDAFRFFTSPARARNELTPTRETQVTLEQPGCLHANMDFVQVGLQARPVRAGGARRGLFRAGGRDSHARHAGEPLRPGRAGLPAGADRDRRRTGRVRSGPERVRPTSGAVASSPDCALPSPGRRIPLNAGNCESDYSLSDTHLLG
jgi:hypothetical protein